MNARHKRELNDGLNAFMGTTGVDYVNRAGITLLLARLSDWSVVREDSGEVRIRMSYQQTRTRSASRQATLESRGEVAPGDKSYPCGVTHEVTISLGSLAPDAPDAPVVENTTEALAVACLRASRVSKRTAVQE